MEKIILSTRKTSPDATLAAIFISVTITLLVSFASPLSALASPITYQVVSYPTDQDGYDLSGYIMTDGTIGTISEANIIAWSITEAKGSFSFSFSSASPTAHIGAQGVSASATAIVISEGTVSLNHGISAQDSAVGADIDWSRPNYVHNPPMDTYFSIANNQYLWNTELPAMGGSDPWIVATVVPEPSTFALLGFSAVYLLVYPRRRK